MNPKTLFLALVLCETAHAQPSTPITWATKPTQSGSLSLRTLEEVAAEQGKVVFSRDRRKTEIRAILGALEIGLMANERVRIFFETSLDTFKADADQKRLRENLRTCAEQADSLTTMKKLYQAELAKL